jgi:NADPH-dependent 2,4-dienoyl-CoA reductase/sulfur reductase-like enzyme
MNLTRRQLFLGTACALWTPRLLAQARRPKVIVIGGGWGGLAAARQLVNRCDVLLLERQPSFMSLPLTNRWLGNVDDGKRLYQNYQAAADVLGYRFLQTDVLGIERERRQVRTAQGNFPYDWLIVSAGIAEADGALFAGDKDAAAFTRQHFSSAYTPGAELAALKARLSRFKQGEFLMSLPPAPYRCPPAPYERAVMIAHLIKSQGLKARLTLVEPNAPWPGYQRVFNEFFREQIHYLPNTRLRSLDPYKKVATLDIDDLTFDDAIIMPPQQAAAICQQAGIIGPDSVWVAVNPKNFAILDDERIFVVGDSVGSVSPLFGHYPKTGQMASRMGQIAATEIIARIDERPAEPALPESTCFAYLNFAPAQFTRIETRYRLRGDGALTQSISQTRENNPQGEDDAWLNARHAELFGSAARS